MITGIVTLGVIPVTLNGEIAFFRFMYDVDDEVIFVPLEPIWNVSEVTVPPSMGIPALAWDLQCRRVERMIVIHEDDGYHYEEWPEECEWVGIPDEMETCLRVVNLLKIEPRGPVIAEA